MPQLSIDEFLTKKVKKLSTASNSEPDSNECPSITVGNTNLMEPTESVESSRQAGSLDGGDLIPEDSIQNGRKELENNSTENAATIHIVISDDEDHAQSSTTIAQGNDTDSNGNKESVKKEESSGVEEQKTKKRRERTEFLVESVKDHCFKDGMLQYLVKWKNYPPSENSWEPEDHLKNCTSILDTYTAQKEKDKRTRLRQFPEEKYEHTGFARGLQFDELLGFHDDFGEFEALIKWKKDGSGQTHCDLVPVDKIYTRAPSIITDFMTTIIRNSNPLVQKAKKDAELKALEKSGSETETSDESEDEPADVVRKHLDNELPEQFGEVMTTKDLKNPVIVGVYHINDASYYAVKEKKSDSKFIVPLNTAHKFYPKAVFIYFEKNIVRGLTTE